MTREEAINWLDRLYMGADITDEYGDMVDMQPYEEAFNMAIEALEQEPKQVELEGDGYADGEFVYDYGKCPSCGWNFEEGDKDWKEPYCCHCGQKLKWFEESEDKE